MIIKTHRFNHRLAVQAVYRQAKTVRGPMVSIKYLTKNNQPWRAAIVVSKKVSKSAVKRNRIRRRIYEWLRINDSKILPGAQMIVSIFDESFINMPADKFDNLFEKLIDQVR